MLSAIKKFHSDHCKHRWLWWLHAEREGWSTSPPHHWGHSQRCDRCGAFRMAYYDMYKDPPPYLITEPYMHGHNDALLDSISHWADQEEFDAFLAAAEGDWFKDET